MNNVSDTHARTHTHTIVVKLFTEYPAFQDFLLINNFLQLGLDIAKNDSESYVRASALAFISTTIKINKLWKEKLSELNLLVRLVENIRTLTDLSRVTCFFIL